MCAFEPRSSSPSQRQIDAQTDESMGKTSQKAPTRRQLDAVANLPVRDGENKSIPFKSLYEGKNRVLVIFVRHFFCGQCQEFMRTLSDSVTPEDLLKLSTPTELVIIGCGQPELIPFYKEQTHCRFPLYADPTRALYTKLGMARTMEPGAKPEYIRKSFMGVAFSSFLQAVTAGRNTLRGGDFWQVGGEFLFENGTVTKTHRMTTTRDHSEMDELKSWLGLTTDREAEENERIAKKTKRSSLAVVTAAARRSFSAKRSPNRKQAVRRVSGSSKSSK